MKLKAILYFKQKNMNWIYKLIVKFNIHVYVVVAYNTDRDKFKDCKVFFDSNKAFAYKYELSLIYGNSNVALFSRFIN